VHHPLKLGLTFKLNDLPPISVTFDCLASQFFCTIAIAVPEHIRWYHELQSLRDVCH
jgi:hypothetical protein